MSVFSDVFEVLDQKGLAQKIRANKDLGLFLVKGLAWIIVFGAVYGLSMGISVNRLTVIRDVIKVPLMFIFALGMSFPAFYLAARLSGLKETAPQLAAGFLTFFIIYAAVLAIAAPVIFFYAVATKDTRQLFFAHIVINNVAVLLSVFVMSVTLYNSVEGQKSRLVLPIAVGMIFVVLAVLALALFFQPFFRPSKSFAVGWARLVKLLALRK